jgi:hypothetical protein
VIAFISRRLAADAAMAAAVRMLEDDLARTTGITQIYVLSLDESGKLNDCAVVAFGGCLAHASTMQSFAGKWDEVLGDLPYISMKEALTFNGPFKCFKDDPAELYALLRRLARLGREVCRVDVAITTAHFKTLPQSVRREFGNPVYYGFEACIRMSLKKIPSNAALLVECDLSEEYSEKCIRLFHKLRRDYPDIKERTAALQFGDDQLRRPLQFADMVSYCSRADAMRAVRQPQPIIDELVAILKSPNREKFQFDGCLGAGVLSLRS